MPVTGWREIAGKICEQCGGLATHFYGPVSICCSCHAGTGGGLLDDAEARNEHARHLGGTTPFVRWEETLPVGGCKGMREYVVDQSGDSLWLLSRDGDPGKEPPKVVRIVRLHHGRRWHCTCPAFEFSKAGQKECLHVRALRPAAGNREHVEYLTRDEEDDMAWAADDKELAERLAEPFPADVVGWKPQSVKNNRALAVAYIDARDVESRLDDVFGVGGWQDSYTVLPNKSVVCTLRIKVGNEWIEKSDVGSESEQPDEGDRTKAAFSDALKRAAVKLGIGRYLYNLPLQWCDYDPQFRKFTQTPRLPDSALPKKRTAPAPRQIEQKPAPQMPANGSPSADGMTKEEWETVKGHLKAHGISQADFLHHFEVAKPSEIKGSMVVEALSEAQFPTDSLLAKARKPQGAAS